MTQIDDERLGLPSASGARLRRHCLGQHQLVTELRKAGKLVPEPPSPAAKSGNVIHSAWAGNPEEELSVFEASTLDILQRLEKMVVTDWCQGLPCEVLGRELRLYLRKGIMPIASGALDVAYIQYEPMRILILDAKTLTGQVDPAHSNDQLRELVALTTQNYSEVSEITVGLLRPNVAERTSLSVYDQLECHVALAMLFKHLEEIALPNRPRTPGDWCRYCQALPFCPQAHAYASEPSMELGLQISKGTLALPIGHAGTELLSKLLAARPLIERLTSMYKALLAQEPDALPGYHLRPGKQVREITDILAAWEAANQVEGFDLAAFLSATKLSVTKLEAALGKATGRRGRDLRQTFSDVFGEVTQMRTDAPELERE